MHRTGTSSTKTVSSTMSSSTKTAAALLSAGAINPIGSTNKAVTSIVQFAVPAGSSTSDRTELETGANDVQLEIEPCDDAEAEADSEQRQAQHLDRTSSSSSSSAAIQAQAQDTRTAKDSDFLESYYQKSRLHHLSVWRNQFQQQLQDQVSNLIGLVESDTTEADHLIASRHPRLIFHVDMVRRRLVLTHCAGRDTDTIAQ